MDPRQYNWNADQQVVVTNPTSQDFQFQVHGKLYAVPAGKTVKMPGFIAWKYVHDLSIKMGKADGKFKQWNQDGVPESYREKIVVSVEEVIQAVETVDEAATTFSEEDFDDDLGEDEGETDKETNGMPGVKPMERKRGRPAKN